MDHNLLEHVWIGNTTSGIGYSAQNLTRDELRQLGQGTASITVTSGNYVGIEAQLGTDYVCDEIRLCLDDDAAGFIGCAYRVRVDTALTYDGAYNPNEYSCHAVMSSNDTPTGYAVDADGSYNPTNNPAWYAFDSNGSSAWVASPSTPADPTSIMYTFPSPKIINKYRFYRSSSTMWHNTPPDDFKLQGSNMDSPDVSNDAHWVTLDERAGWPDGPRPGWGDWATFEATVAYRHYRIRATAPNSEWSIPNIILAEAGNGVITPLSYWYNQTMTYSGGCYRYVFDEPIGIEAIRIFYANDTGSATLSGAMLLTTLDQVTVSGHSPAAAQQVTSFDFNYNTTDPELLDIKNNMDGSAQPHVYLQYTGTYNVDRNIFMSADYPTLSDKDSATWWGLDEGYSYPEVYPWILGDFSGTQETSQRVITLSGSELTGTWTSPVFDYGQYPGQLQVYGRGDILVEARCGESAPAPINFLVTTTQNTDNNLMYNHKRVYITSYGEILGSEVCDGSESEPTKLWRVADPEFVDKPLHYYGSVNNLGAAGFFLPGILECGDINYEDQLSSYTGWYNLCSCTTQSDDSWRWGATVSGFPWGDNESVLFTKAFPTDNSNGFFTMAITNNTVDNLVRMSMAFQYGNTTRLPVTLITLRDVSLDESAYLDIAEDRSNNGWWVYIGGSVGRIYKIDVGSYNTVKYYLSRYDGYEVSSYNYEYSGYIYDKTFATDTRSIVGIPSPDYTGFWALSASGVSLYEEVWELDEPELFNRKLIQTSVLYGSGFEDLRYGSCDQEGNLWAVDQTQGRILRFSLSKQKVDFDNFIGDAISVWAHPENGSAYVLVSPDSGAHSGKDLIYQVSYGQSIGSIARYVCTVPGFSSKPYLDCVCFEGYAFTDSVRPHNTDRNWGDIGLDWQPYTPGTDLPRGRYKQFRITLSRNDLEQSSPRLEHFRLPQPLVMEHLDRLQTRQLAVKTVFNSVTDYGSYDAKIIVWWGDEEYNG